LDFARDDKIGISAAREEEEEKQTCPHNVCPVTWY